MIVTIDENSGFCFGVTTAIETAERELQKGTLFCLGDIVHNGQEVKRLDKLGLETIDYDDLRTLRNVRVLLRAHGEPPSTYRIAKQNNIEIIDASCPVVLNLQKRIREKYQAIHGKNTGAQIVIFGKKGHAEVIGLEGQTNNTAIVIESISQLHQLDFTRPIYLFSQTTKSVEEFQQIVAEIKQRKIENDTSEVVFEYHDTICRNVANRVKRLQDFARGNDVVIFVGGQKSSNAKVLFQNCMEVNSCTVFVSSEADLTPEILQQCHAAEKVGICGATSTPKWLMERIKQHIEHNNGI
ncbi:MAG: 4-hydroxy-3-methylbut-2-enyl diphosphate reductase [Paludibacteraceae bacterium]|nr:4-hydroxy-3-methylbut-2-enyl diphosphate reductase [Paludibacteraceae bacterium]MBQ2439429.1 4-hydroxy-3-methylbut-2-enyl diphosphate reductase [Paludibacteraceae bacterium]